MLTETAYAKINLALHVRGRAADGYHRLETLFAFAEDGDMLGLEDADGLSLTVDGPFADALAGEGDNLILRAARAFSDTVERASGRFRLTKKLPVASGIGGGSADAAGALRLLCARHGVPIDRTDVQAIAAGLGADVPACLTSVAQFGEGRGDRLTPAGAVLAGAPLLLVNPGVPLSTAPVFRGWDGVDRGPLDPADPWGGRNDLEAPARALRPEIGDVLALLAAQAGVRLSRMSGSGATCFALFSNEAARDAADRAVAAARPGWWRMASRIR